MNKTLIITVKEIVDNLRDKRSVFFALVYGSLLMPALLMGPLIYGANKQFSQNYETPAEIHVLGQERAPNLIQHLYSRNVDTKPAPEDYRQKLIDGDLKLVLEISETYGEKFLEGSPARVLLHYNQEEGESQGMYWRIRGELDGYSRQIASQRMAIRGFDQQVLRPLDIVESELSKDDQRAGILGNLIMFLIILSMTMGGFYLAVDSTAGERERLSLEPLLSLPVSRFQVALGKYLAILVFVTIAFLLPMLSVAIATQFIPDEFFGNADVPGAVTFLKLVLLNFPLCVLLTGFLMAIAAFSKSIKEAQTQLGFAMLVPMAPFFVVQFMDVDLTTATSAIPILGQYLLADQVIMDAGFSLAAALPSVLTTLGLGGLFFAQAVQLYRQDSILG